MDQGCYCWVCRGPTLNRGLLYQDRFPVSALGYFFAFLGFTVQHGQYSMISISGSELER